jgi:hypothetical protein
MPTNGPTNDVAPEMLALIAKRLRPVCPSIPQEEFDNLVLDVARLRAKYEEPDGRADGADDRAQSTA